MPLFLAIPLGFFFVEQQAEESMENKMLFCLLFSSEQAIYGTTGFIISGLLLDGVVTIGRYPLALSPFCILLSCAVCGVSGRSRQPGWSRGRV